MAKEKKLGLTHVIRKGKPFWTYEWQRSGGAKVDLLYMRLTYERKSTLIRSFTEQAVPPLYHSREECEQNDIRILEALHSLFLREGNVDIGMFNTRDNPRTKKLTSGIFEEFESILYKGLINSFKSKGVNRIFEYEDFSEEMFAGFETISEINPELLISVFETHRNEIILAQVLDRIEHPNDESLVHELDFYKNIKIKFLKPKNLCYVSVIDILEKTSAYTALSKILASNNVDIDSFQLEKMFL